MLRGASIRTVSDHVRGQAPEIETADPPLVRYGRAQLVWEGGVISKRGFWRAGLVAVAFAAMSSGSARTQDVSNSRGQSVDLLITGGLVYAGDLSPARIADIGITGDRIVFIGDAASAGLKGTAQIDARGLMVAPGFIDAHTHAEADLLSDDPNTRLVLRQLAQGVTTSIIGVDGSGAPEIQARAAKAVALGVGNNFASYVGFGAVRQRVLGDDARAPSTAELTTMKSLVRQAMCEGALGLSAGLFYAPQSFASTEEVIEVATEAGRHGGLYDTHQRDEGTTSIGVVASTREQIRIGKESGATLHLAHFKVSSGARPDGQSMKELIALVEAGRSAGQAITADQYPWTASSTGLVAMAIPRWAQDGGRAAMLKRFSDPAQRSKIRAESNRLFEMRGGPKNVLIHTAASQPELVGKTVEQIAAAWSADPAETAIRILTKGNVSVAIFSITEPDIKALMVQPWTMFSSDGANGGHPRGHASYPRFWANYVSGAKVITPVEFVHKSTGLVADTLGLAGRGYLKPGHFADVVMIDTRNYAPKATFEAPRLLSTGVVHVVVNGKVEMRDGKPTGARAGRGLSKQVDASKCG